jgi:hypothetical protein
VAFSRVLSPQYILWLVLVIPLLTGAAGVAAEALLLAACAVTMTWFPGRFVHLQHISPVSWFVLVRNVLLVLVFAAAAWPLLRRHEAPARSAEQIRHEEVPQG